MQLLKDRTIKNISNNSYVLNRDTLNNGVYIIKLKGNKGTSYKDKIVIE